MRLTIAASSNLKEADYDAERRRLTVTFQDGRSYTYEGVERDVAEGLSSAPSAGRYFNDSIRGRFTSVKGAR